jgi:hypothetical protein
VRALQAGAKRIKCNQRSNTLRRYCTAPRYQLQTQH